jgi:hypothetical protein
LEKFIEGDWKLCAVDDLDVFKRRRRKSTENKQHRVATEKGICGKLRTV